MAHQAFQDRLAPPEFCDHEYWPVTIQLASSARLSANVVPLRLAESAIDLLHEFLVGGGAHGGFSIDWLRQIIARRAAFFQSIVNMIYIHSMNLNSLDLNLLVALDALLREASVSRAALRIGLSQPAASHALQRLRDLVGDPLLVRSGARMELTPRAQALRGPLAQALDQIRGLFVSDDFDAASSERHFRLMMPDLAVELLMPPLMEKVTKAAPNVTIDVVPWRGPAIFTAEFARTIDLVISIGDAFRGFHRQRLYTDSDALAVRRGHPAGAKLGRKDAFLDARHVAVVIRGQNEDLIDGWLRTKGIERRIALVVPGYIEALHVTARTDLVAFVPRRLIGALAKQLSLMTVTPPLDPGIDEQFLFYPTRAQMDRIDLAAQHHARHRPRDGTRQAQRRVTPPCELPQCEDLGRHAGRRSRTDADRDNPVEPTVSIGAGLEQQRGPEIILRRRNRIALAKAGKLPGLDIEQPV